MKLHSAFFTDRLGDKQVMISSDDTLFKGIVSNNETAAFIVDQLKQDTTQEAIVDAMISEYDAPRELIEKAVAEILDKLRGIHAIVE